VDIEEDALNIDVTQIKKKITSNTKAIMVIHAMGHPSDMDPVVEIAKDHNLYVIEDSTHSLGAKYKGKHLPIGDISLIGMLVKGFWLPTGGAMGVSDDKETIDKLKLLRTWMYRREPELLKDKKGKGIINATKSNPSDLDAAVGIVQLSHLDEYIDLQRKNASLYTEMLEDTPVITPVEKDYAYHVYLRYVIKAEKRDALKNYLAEKGIASSTPYSTSAYRYPYYQKKYGFKAGDFPVSDKCKALELALPEPRPRTLWEIEYVTQSIKEFYS
jgi:dTDP-4-amino-4,6-dideoxygalactose transaminase